MLRLHEDRKQNFFYLSHLLMCSNFCIYGRKSSFKIGPRQLAIPRHYAAGQRAPNLERKELEIKTTPP